MFFTSLVIGVLAGLGVPYVAGPLTEFTKNRFELNERETGIASFGAVLVVAGLIGGIIAKDAAEAAEDAVEDVVEDVKDVAEETAEKVVKKAKKTTKS